jgi:hypothetical protein
MTIPKAALSVRCSARRKNKLLLEAGIFVAPGHYYPALSRYLEFLTSSNEDAWELFLSEQKSVANGALTPHAARP